MTPLRLTASEWIEKYRQGEAAMIDGRRHVVARVPVTGEPTYIEVDVEEPDVRCAVLDGQLDAQDLARVLTSFRGQPVHDTPTMRCVRTSADGDATAYVFDDATCMTYLLD